MQGWDSPSVTSFLLTLYFIIIFPHMIWFHSIPNVFVLWCYYWLYVSLKYAKYLGLHNTQIVRLSASKLKITVPLRSVQLTQAMRWLSMLWTSRNMLVVAGQEKPHMCIWPLNMNTEQNIWWKLIRISLTMFPGLKHI